MKKNISILGSTGSVGLSTLKIIDKKKNFFRIILLAANNNYRLICDQIKKYKPEYFIINNFKVFLKVKKKFKNNQVKIFNNFEEINLKKLDLSVAAIPGIAGLEPTLLFIKLSKKILIANKESIICGWTLMRKLASKSNTTIIPVDSEHYSIFKLIENINQNEIEKIYLTASGGPFLNYKKKELLKISPKEALKHPKWKMGKKITIDSATMVNKVFELIEAKNIFNISYKKLSILIHPTSYIHAIIKYQNGLSKIILHDTDMKIPIFNSLSYPLIKEYKDKALDIKKLNKLELSNVNLKRFPSVKILKYLPNKFSLFETVLVSANDELVNLFLKKQIKFTDISKKLLKIIRSRKFKKFKGLQPKKIDDIIKLNGYVRSVIN